MPRKGTALVHRDLLTSWRDVGHFDDRVTIEESSSSRSATGEVTRTWSTLAGHGNLRCRLSPVIGRSAGGGHGVEHRDDQGDWVEHTHVCALSDHYPAIDETHRAVIGTRTFGVVLVARDSAETGTLLWLRILDEQGSART